MIQNTLQAILCIIKGTIAHTGKEQILLLVKKDNRFLQNMEVFMCVSILANYNLLETYKNQLDQTKPVQEKIRLLDSDNSAKHKSNFQEFEITGNYEDENNRSLSNIGDQCVGKD